MTTKNNPGSKNLSSEVADSQKLIVEAIWREYELLDSNYSYRDRLVPYEFYIALGVLGILVGLYESLNAGIVTLCFMFGVGAIALYVLHIDMMSNVSCKKAIRMKMQGIEADIEQLRQKKRANPRLGNFSLLDFPELQRIIDKRDRYKLEKMLKFMSAGDHMIWGIRIAAIGWVAFFVFSILN